jgi:Fur family transcriptional regulator, peroxide stress response regulator
MSKAHSTNRLDRKLDHELASHGLRSTRKRHLVYNVLLARRDHPTVEEVYLRARESMDDISLATVYNCLDALVDCGLVREVNLDRAPTRYCPNMGEHSHFYCDSCERVVDLDDAPSTRLEGLPLPKGFQPRTYEVAVRGLCPECSRRQ